MLEKLKYLLKHSFIYSISNLATKASGVILLPIYSSFFSVSEFGVLGILEITISIFTEVLNLGLGQSLVMLSNHSDHIKKRKSIFYTLSLISFSIIFIFIALGELILPFISAVFKNGADFYIYLRLSIYIISLRVINIFFSNKLRADEKSVWFTVSSLSKLGLTISLIAYFVALKKIGISGVLYSYVISEFVLLVFLIPVMFKQMYLHFEKEIIKLSIKFGFPLVFMSIAMLILNVSDRYILKYFTNYNELGLYDLGYRIAGVVNMFIIVPFNMALIPIAYQMYNQEGDKRYFSKLLTYITLLLVWIGMAISIFSEQIIKIFALNPDYWGAAKVIPIIVFSYIFFGMRIVANLGMLLSAHTKPLAFVTIIASILNIVLNFIFIPRWGMMAAAYSTLISFIFLYWITYLISQKYYRIPYENGKTIIIIFMGVLIYLLTLLLNINAMWDFIIRFIIVLIFPVVLYFLKLFEVQEINSIIGFYKKWKNPVIWRKNLRDFSHGQK